MAATKYQVLYRYINEAINTAITNSMDNAYNPVCEFYTDPDHKIFSSSPTVQADAVNDQQEMISYGNSSTNPKTNMLFAYDGTKKIKHQKWVEETTGYVVRDYTRLKRSVIGNQGDFTKEFTTLNAATPEDGGLVVCTKKVFDKYFPSTITVADNGSYTASEIQKKIIDATLFSLNTGSWEEHMSPSNIGSSYSYYSSSTFIYYVGPITVDTVIGLVATYGKWSTIPMNRPGNLSDAGLYSKATIKKEQIETTTIPGHYEDVIDAPYLIKDTYKRIQLSPWFVNYTCGSLEAALNKARVLVDMLGIENVKLIKVVPFDQFVKIK